VTGADVPGVSGKWDLWVSKGNPGADGSPGATGSTGPQGLPGQDGSPGATGSVSSASSLILSQISTPSAPSAGNTAIYAKSDGKIYKLPAGGTEEAIGTGGVSPSAGREVLTADRVYFVRIDGNDSNTGLANTAGGAFLTIPKANDVAKKIDLNGFNLKIKIADGDYISQGKISPICPIGGGDFIIEGNTTTPENVKIGQLSLIGQSAQCRLILDGFLMEHDAPNGTVFEVKSSTVFHGRLKYSGNGFVINVSGGSKVLKYDQSSIHFSRKSTNNSLSTLLIVYGQSSVDLQEMTAGINFSGSPTFGLAVFYCEGMGYINVGNVPLNGSYGGNLNTVSGNSTIRTQNYSYISA
jgi:hypothetical protein